MIKLRTAASWVAWPALVFGFIAAYAECQRRGYDPGLSILVITVVHFIIIAALEVLMPARRDWDWRTDRQVFNDLVHGALLGVGERIGGALLTIALATIAAGVADGRGLWPAAWPLWTQVSLAVLIFDFVDYWKHRAFHAWNWLWPVHALHHNPDRMHIFKAGRLHLLEASIRAAVTMAPIVALGAPAEVIFWMAALLNAVGDTNHWNVETRLPRVLHALVATPQAHWLHHAKHLPNGTRNLSSFTLLFDHVFGTYQRPDDRRIEDVGIGLDPISRHVFGQVLTPLTWRGLAARKRKPVTDEGR